MSKKFSQRQEKFLSIDPAVAFEALRESLIDLCGPIHVHDSRPEWLRRGARSAGVSFSKARRIFYRESTNPDWRTVQRIQSAVFRLDQTSIDQPEEAHAA